jgi:LysR family transcriptional activator of mexEF-oprN operon
LLAAATTSERILRIGLADSAESWLLPRLVRVFEREAPRMRVVAVPIQFRTVGDALATRRIDCAVTVADELPRSIARRQLFRGGFVCLFDPRHTRLGPRPSEKEYLAKEHVIVSYNGDLRGVIEDSFGKQRRVRCSVASFGAVGPLVDGSSLVATVPEIVAAQILHLYPQLRSAALPFHMPKNGVELLWPTALDGDDALRFLRSVIERLAVETNAEAPRKKPNAIRPSTRQRR